MAKRIVIEGTDILTSINDPWSGKNNDVEAIEVYGTTVPPRAEWGVNLREIERIIKATFGDKVGYQKVVSAPDGIANRIVSFASQDDFDEWDKLTDNEKWSEEGRAFIVTWDTLPALDIGDTYYVDVQVGSYSPNQPNTDISLNIKGVSYVKHAAGTEELIQERLTIQVQTRTSDTAAWQTRDSFNITSNLEYWSSISFAPYLVSGMNYIRLKVIGEYAEGLVWRPITINVVGLSLTPNTATNVPVSGNKLTLNYLVGGNIDKYLRLQFGTGIGDSFEADWTYDNCDKCNILVRGVNTSTGFTFDFTPSQNALTDVLTNGLHTVRAQLYVDEGLKTEWKEIQYMVAQDESVNPMVVINNVNNNLDNFTDVKFFDWASNKDITVRFRLTDENNVETYGVWEQEATREVLYSLQTQLNIEYQGVELYGLMHIEDTNGNPLHPEIYFTISNNSDYAPVSNPTFIFQPSTRSNDEANPRTIINTATGEVVPSTGWESLGMTIADGYTGGAFVVPSGSQIGVGFNPLRTVANPTSSATGLTAKNVTIEIDFKSSNITDDTKALIRLGSYFNTQNDNDIWGIEVRATEAALLTFNNRTRDDQNVTWAEDRRTRLTFNVVYGLNPDNDPQGTKLNYIRLFVNDTIEKEIEYLVNDRFIEAEDMQLLLGGEGADLTIYNIRCYEKALNTDDVMKDYRAGLSTTAEKDVWIAKNDILGDDNTIDMTKAINAGYNVIGHTGHLPKYGDSNKGKTTGVKLMIHIDGEPEHSGVLDNLESTGQGTTAMTYYDWNQQYKISDTTVFTPEVGEPTAPGTGYAVAEGEALAKKLVGKINFASSMQGHKMGITRLYDEVFKELVRTGNMSEPGQIALQDSARLTVLERPFLFFHRETEDDAWTFRYLMTFGAGKGDKPTFGFNKNTTPHMLMVEGADNDRTLALFNAPWNSEVTYNAEEEAWCIGNQKHINFGYGKTSVVNDEEVPSDTDAITAMQNFWNFVYLHSRNISYYTGTLAQLKAGAAYAEGINVPSANVLYWITSSQDSESDRYDLYRFDVLTNDWEKAGLETNITLNVRTQYESMCSDLGIEADTWPVGQWAAINTKIQAVRTAHFKANADTYMHVDDVLYHDAIIKLVAGTDNRSKNTYYYTDPVTLKIRQFEDDLDTTIKTNNVGQQRKPYYVEEHDKNSAGEFYWQGESSGFYNLLEEAFADELKLMMRRILASMATLAGSGNSTFDYLVSRILEAQDTFPAVAYNEFARLVYERASIAQHDGIYVNAAVRAITQSNGTQYWSEYQWLLDRLMYISSWCEYGEFAAGTQSAGSLTFRGQTGVYKFVLTPAKWLYPRVGQGSSNVAPSRNSNHVRVPAGEAFAYGGENGISNDGDTSISIRGINYYSKLGDMNIPVSSTLQTTFPFFGNKLKEITVNPDGEDTNLFVTQNIVVTSTNIDEFVVRNVDTLTSSIDLSNCLRLKKVDLRGSTPPRVILPETASLTEVYLPESVTEVVVHNCPNLETLSISHPSNVQKIDLSNVDVDVWDIINDIYTLYANGETVALNNVVCNINETIDDIGVLIWLGGLANANVTGSVVLDNSVNMTFLQKEQLIQMFGNIDSDENPLRIIYNYNINPALEVAIFCNGVADVIKEVGQYQFRYIPLVGSQIQTYANYISSVEWLLDENNYATIDDNGLMTVNRIGLAANSPTIQLTLRATLLNGTVLTDTLTISMYDREVELGDYVYPDGTYSKVDYKAKTKIGICFIKENGVTEICTLNDLNSAQWGLIESSVTGVTTDGTTKAYDTPLSNVTRSNSFIAKDTNANYFDVESDAFVLLPADSAQGQLFFSPTVDTVIDGLVENVRLEAGKNYSAGYRNTLILMNWRNRILSYAEKNIPVASENETETQSLSRLISAIIDEAASQGASNSSYYCQYYYPAASYCHAYQPIIKSYETLNDKFKTHKWFLPACGELARMVFYWLRNDTTENSKYDAFKAAKDNNKIVFTKDSYWCSSEFNEGYAWDVRGRDGAINDTTPGHGQLKSRIYTVRPVCTL